MEAEDGSQKALQIAFQTLKERCRHFQQHIATLEAENVKLKGQVNENDVDSISEVDVQKQRIRELAQQNAQLQTHLNIVSNENKQLWTELSKLTEVNKSLGTQLTKINESLSQSSKKPVTRSQTYTISDPTQKSERKALVLDENEKVSLELEDISLKLINNIAKEKMELEMQYSQMMEIQNSNFMTKSTENESGNEFEDTVVDEYLQNFSNIKYVLLEEKNKLLKILQNLETVKKEEKTSHNIGVQTDQPRIEAQGPLDIEISTIVRNRTSTNTSSLTARNTLEQNYSLEPDISNIEKICPMCCLAFSNDTTYMEFQNHVVEHFAADDQPEYEVI